MSVEKKGSKIHVFVINDVKNEEWDKEELDDSYNTDGDTPKGGSPNGEGTVGGDKSKVINTKKNKRKEIIRHKMYHPQVKIVKVSCGKSIIGFLSVVGKIYCWQLNGFDDFDKNVPYLLVDPVLKNKIIHDVSSGDSHIAFISKEGDLFTYGDNTYGQLGNGDDTVFDSEDGLASTRECTPDSTSETDHSFSTLEEDVRGTSNADEVDTKTKKKKHQMSKVNKVSRVHKVDVENNIVKCVYSRDKYTLYLTIDGFLYGFGLINEHFIQGQKNKAMKKRILTKPCLIDTNNIAFKKIAIGNNFILGISFNNSLYSWGDNTNGVLGYDDCAESHEPKLVDSMKNVTYVSAGRVSLCKTVEDDLYIWGGTYGSKPSMVKNKFSQMVINKNFIIGLCAKKNIWVKKIDTISHGYYINNLKIDLLCSYDNLIIGVENHSEGELEPVHADAKVAIQGGSTRKGKDQVENIPLGGNAPNETTDNMEEALKGVEVADNVHDDHGHLSDGDVPPEQQKGSEEVGEQLTFPNDRTVSTVLPSDMRKDVTQNCDDQVGDEDSPPNKHPTGEEEKSNGIPQVGSKSSFDQMDQFPYEGMTESNSPKVDATNGSDCTEGKSYSWNEKENTTQEKEPTGNTYNKLIDAETEEDDYFDEEEHFLATNFYGKPEIPNVSDTGGGIATNKTTKGKEKVNLKSALKKFPSSERLKKSVSFSNYVYDFAKSNYELMSGVSSGEEMDTTIVDRTNQTTEPALSPLPTFHYDAPRGKETNGSEPVGVDAEVNNAGTTHPPDEDIFSNYLESMPNGNPSEDKLRSHFIWHDPPQECISEEAPLNGDWDKNNVGQKKEGDCPPLDATADRIGSEVIMHVGNLKKEEALKGDTKYMQPLMNDHDKGGPLENISTDSVDTRCANWGGKIEEEHNYPMGTHIEGGFKERIKSEKAKGEVNIELNCNQKGVFKQTGEYHIVGSNSDEASKADVVTLEEKKWKSGFDWNGNSVTQSATTLRGKDVDNFHPQNPNQRSSISTTAKPFPLSDDKNGKRDGGSFTPTVRISLKKKNQQGRKKLKIKYNIYKKVKCLIRKKKMNVPKEMSPVGTKLTLLHPPQLKEAKQQNDKVDPPLVEMNHVIGTNVIVPSDICQCCGGRSPHGTNIRLVKKKDSTHKKGDPGKIPLEDGCTKKTSMSVNKKASTCDSSPCVKKKKTLSNDNATKVKTHKTGKKQIVSSNKDKPACSNKGSASGGEVQSGPFCITCSGENTNGVLVSPAQECQNGRKSAAAKMRRNSSSSNIYNEVCADASLETKLKGSKLKRNNYFSDSERRTTCSDHASSGNTSHLHPTGLLSKSESCTNCYGNGMGEINEKKWKAHFECMKQTGEGGKNRKASFQLGLAQPVINSENHSLSRGIMDSCAGRKCSHGSNPSLEKNTCWGEHFPAKGGVSAGHVTPMDGEDYSSFNGSVDSKLCRKVRGVKKDTSRCHSEVVKKSKLPGGKRTNSSGESQLERIEWTNEQDLCNYHGGENPSEANSQMVLHDEATHPRVESLQTVRTSPKKKVKRKTSEGALCVYTPSGSNDKKVESPKVVVPKKGKQKESAETFPILSKERLSNCNRKTVTRGGSKGGKINQAKEEQVIALADEGGKKKQKEVPTTTKQISVDPNKCSRRDVLKKLGRQIRRMKNDIALDNDSEKIERRKGKEQNGQGGFTAEIELIDGEYSPDANEKCKRLYQKVRGKLRGDHIDGETTPPGMEKKRMKKLLKDVQYIYEKYKYIKKEKEENEKKKNYLKKVLESTVMKTNQVIRLNKSSFQVYMEKMRKENLFLKSELDEESHQHHYDLQQLVNKITHLEQVKDMITRQNEEVTKRNLALTAECEKYKKREDEMRNTSWENDYNELKEKYNSVKAQNGELLKRSDEFAKRNDELAQRNDELVQRNDDLAQRNDDLAERNEQLREEARSLRRELHTRKDQTSGNSAQQIDALSEKGTPLKRNTTATAASDTTNNSTLEDLPIRSSSESNFKRTHGRYVHGHPPGEENKSKQTEEKKQLHLEEGNTPNGEALSTHLAFLKDRLKEKWNPSKEDSFLVDPILEGIIQMALNHLGKQNEGKCIDPHLSSIHPNGGSSNGATNMVNTANPDGSTATPEGEEPKNENLKKVIMQQMDETMTLKQNCSHDNEGEATTQQVQGHHIPSNEATESKTDTYDTLSSEINVDSDDSFAPQKITQEGKFDTAKKNSTKGETQKWGNLKLNYTPSADFTGSTHTTQNTIHSELGNETAEKVNGLNGMNGASGTVQWVDDDGEASQTDDRHIINEHLEKKKKKKKKNHSGEDNYNDGETDETNEHPLDERLLNTKIRGLNEKGATKGEGVKGSTTSPSNEVTTKTLSKKNTQLKEIQKNDFLLLHDTNRKNKNNTFDQVATEGDASTGRKKVIHPGDVTSKQNGPGDNSKGKKKELNAMLDCIFDTSSDHSSISANMVSIQSLIENNLKNIFSVQD
ncbi:Uncharacterized protein PCOAH_00017200 [Plasmodium coatneyi]|uniref:Regulator of chromosome condensation n=1 Tax=Plasmodium coatneyi TaxID=208452 RepID=A0A1B1DWR5_9APIC|nr:Uncharacterized protein PCOAH_00017200 [Plasmodium coatneyi]ANQ07236.1 Uncharacterized protein PCOAH_00017200 [Plasmodium coatneyi]